ncbi:sterol desaturase family protein [Uliginosibacterium sediminicola]|uniref:Sterol desaturase family protein n=1 Tax=Uliginosibacterium sediminicola TaxID=2024550 RepID=A0ABU9YT58_9RHOO
MNYLSDLWLRMVDALANSLVAPVLADLQLSSASLNPHDIAGALMLTVLQLFVIGGIFRPLEHWFPAERWEHRRLARVDLYYTLIMLLGLFPLFSYLVLTPLADFFLGAGNAAEAAAEPSVFNLKHALPGLAAHPLALFLVYYLLYDLLYYWMHRAQHAIPWWWALHSMHHSQRQMSCWCNDRGSYLDGALQSVILAGVAVVVGIEPDEFAGILLLGELVQNFSHANVRIGFGRLFERIFVSPKFHRLHHMEADPQRPDLHNCNFGQVLAVWDNLFSTALYSEPIRPTGVCDPVVDADNQRGLIGMQLAALRRFWGAFRRPAGWRLGDVSFGPDYTPIPSSEAGFHASPNSASSASSS